MNIFNYLDKIIMRYENISFDIFDTLLKRDVYKPRDIFFLVEKKLTKKYGDDFSFYTRRIEAEQKISKAKGHREFTLDEIYDEIEIEAKIKEVAKKTEIDTEVENITINYNMYHLYQSCVKSKKNIYIVSDMYMPIEVIEKLLIKNGINKYKKIFLSAEKGVKKRDGALFRTLLAEEGISPKKLIHIGDNKISDFLAPLSLGILSIKIGRNYLCDSYIRYLSADSREDKIYKTYINNHLPRGETPCYQIGYECLGPIIVEYCKWIHNRIKYDKSEHLFVARDMYIFYKCYKAMYPEENIKYVYMSRRSLIPMLITDDNINEFGDALPRGLYSSIEIANILNIDTSKYKNLISHEKKYDIRRLYMYSELRTLLHDEDMLREMSAKAANAKEYLNSIGFFNSKEVCFIDIGWHGSLQTMLQMIDKGSRIHGLYMGSLESTEDRVGKENFQTCFFNENSDIPFMRGILLFESLILAPHGSTLEYVNTNNEIAPQLEQDLEIERQILDIQEGATKFVEEYIQSELFDLLDYHSSIAISMFENLLQYPKRKDLNELAEIRYENYFVQCLACPDTLFHYIWHPRDLYNDIKMSPWRIGFLYRLFKIPFPYAKCYFIIRKFTKKKT